MRLRRELVVALAVLLAQAAAAEPERQAPGALFDAGTFGNRKDPITVTADTLEYDYKANVIVYRGDVLAAQGDMKVRSDTLTVTLVAEKAGAAPDDAGKGNQRLQQIVAVGNVRIDNGTRWATGGRAVFDQATRTIVLTETPVLHDGSNEVAGEQVVVYLDENRSEVKGGRRRVKAVLYPNKDGGLAAAKEQPRAVEAAKDTAGAPTP